MSESKKKDGSSAPKAGATATLKENGDLIVLNDKAAGAFNIGLGLAAVGLGAALATGGGLTGEQFQHSYLTSYMWGLSIFVGGVWWVTLQHLFGSRASVVMRRVAELLSLGVGVMGVLALPILLPIFMGNDALYPWANHEYLHSSHLLQSKAGYFNSGFFAARMVVYFVGWFLLANYWLKKSLLQDKTTGDVAFYKKLQGRSAPAMIFFALSVTFCSMDLLMTLDPIWFSTIFGVYYFATCVETFHCVLALTLMWLQSSGHLKKSVTSEHYHDLGKMMFAFVCFWTYIGFSQFMLIWYANIPEETHWFHMRLIGGWKGTTLLLVATHFIIPFFGMMSRFMKRNIGPLRFWAVYMLVVSWLDMYWLVAPNLHQEGGAPNLTDLLAWVGMIGVVIATIVFNLKKKALVAQGDPRLKRALAFQNV